MTTKRTPFGVVTTVYGHRFIFKTDGTHAPATYEAWQDRVAVIARSYANLCRWLTWERQRREGEG